MQQTRLNIHGCIRSLRLNSHVIAKKRISTFPFLRVSFSLFYTRRPFSVERDYTMFTSTDYFPLKHCFCLCGVAAFADVVISTLYESSLDL